jgi:hypothetical protein
MLKMVSNTAGLISNLREEDLPRLYRSTCEQGHLLHPTGIPTLGAGIAVLEAVEKRLRASPARIPRFSSQELRRNVASTLEVQGCICGAEALIGGF